MLAWVNDEQNLRAYGSKTDAYAMFSVKLDVGSPPDRFHVLTKMAIAASVRFEAALKAAPAR